jgi:ATP-binding cassette subfamily C protein
MPMWNKNNALNKAFSLLTNTDKFKVIFITVTQIILSLLDLLGVAFFAVLGSLAVTGSSSRPNGDRVNKFLQLLRIDALPIQKQAAFIGLAAAFLLVSKTLLSLYFTRKTMYFLSFRSAQITRNLISKLLSQPLQLIQKRSMQENIYALTGGVGNMMNQIIGSAMVMISDLALVLIMFIGLFYLDPIMSILTLLIFGGVAILPRICSWIKARLLCKQNW